MAQDDDLLRTTRLALSRATHPNYIAGQAVFLQRDVQGFAKGTQARVISVQLARPGEHRYQMLIGEDKFWAYESDLRPTPPGEAPLATGEDGSLSITQRLQSMSLSQRMATLGVDESRRLGNLASTQRMHVLTQEERMQELLKTNRIKTLAGGYGAVANTPADADAGPTPESAGNAGAEPGGKP